MRPRSADSISFTELFEVLSNQRRRHVLDVLSETAAPTTVAVLADEVAEREAKAEAYDGPLAADASRIRTSLDHCHIPKLIDSGVLDHDELAKAVVPGEQMAETVDLMEAARSGRTSMADASQRRLGAN